MNETEMLAAVGRLMMERDAARAHFAAALGCMADMLRGDIDNSRVIVNLTDRSFSWVAPGERPALPATINGVPVCVVSQFASREEQGRIVGDMAAEIAALETKLHEANRQLSGASHAA